MSFWKKKDNLVIIGVVATFFIGFSIWYGGAPFVSNNASASPFNIPFATGQEQQQTLSQCRGKPLVVYFWATWCPSCVKKMGTLNRFAEQFKAQGGEVIALSQDRGGVSTVRSYYTRNGYNNLDIYIEASGQLANAFGVSGFPTTIFIDKNGNEVGRLVGGIDWESPELTTLVDQYFGLNLS
jgi:thiol-disulfide isomerase/thioredoxin